MAFTADTIEIRLIVNGNLVHTMTMPDLTLICAKCDIYFASSAFPPPSPKERLSAADTPDSCSTSTPPPSPSFKMPPSPNSKSQFPTRFIYKIPISCLTGHVVPERAVASQASVQMTTLLAPVMTSGATSPGLLRRSPLLRSKNLHGVPVEQPENERHDSSSSDSGITMLRNNDLSPPESPNVASGGVFHDSTV
ncbi:GTPase-activating Rap/Ran-GAP domain-like protein 3 [Mya arenaria]|uniref:GTPase-activating Rap/Ran-GAP domain-like protein 3 n=1 Tax=Mya arenaria TaxID=6604 RepID=UPI0022E8EEC8|nr:GTPase-activating Rap/Ran-GAP domain-like protein 3 [Mya arenaria]